MRRGTGGAALLFQCETFINTRPSNGHQRLDVSSNLQQAVPDIGHALAGEFHNIDRIPHHVVLADPLEPERLHVER